MSQVDCTVKECIYNEATCCCRVGITVEGDNARQEDETYCGNYEHRGEHCCKNLIQEPSKQTNIKCEVANCKFNDDRVCMAGDIDIKVSDSNMAGQTKCETFEAR